MSEDLNLSEEEWRKKLTPEQFHILREKGTEKPFTGMYWDAKDDGVYCCVACDAELFRHDQKFDAGCGWPSFFESIDDERITKTEDLSHGMKRTEILCARCGSHLGHVFKDGPDPTGLRYCVNSVSLNLKKKEEGKE